MTAALWLILRVLLWALAALLLLAVLALAVPVTAELAVDKGGFAAHLRVLFVRVKLWPRPEKRKEGRGRRAAPAETAPAPPAPPRGKGPGGATGKENQSPAPGSGPDAGPGGQAAGKEQPAPGAPEKGQAPPGPGGGKAARGPKASPPPLADRLPRDLDRLAGLAGLAGGAVRRLLAGLRVHHVKAFLPVYRPDAAATALAVGRVWAALGASLGALQNFFSIAPGEVRVEPDYNGKWQGEASFSCKITTHLFIMVSVGAWALYRAKKERLL